MIGLLLNLLVGKRLGEKGIGLIASLATGLAFVVSVVLALAPGQQSARPVTMPPGGLDLSVGNLQVAWTFRVDTLSVTMMLVVSGVGTLIHIYAIGYMHCDVRHNGDPGRYRRFFVLPQPVHRGHDDPGLRRQLPDAVRRLGRRGAVLLPADRVLV